MSGIDLFDEVIALNPDNNELVESVDAATEFIGVPIPPTGILWIAANGRVIWRLDDLLGVADQSRPFGVGTFEGDDSEVQAVSTGSSGGTFKLVITRVRNDAYPQSPLVPYATVKLELTSREGNKATFETGGCSNIIGTYTGRYRHKVGPISGILF